MQDGGVGGEDAALGSSAAYGGVGGALEGGGGFSGVGEAELQGEFAFAGVPVGEEGPLAFVERLVWDFEGDGFIGFAGEE